MAKTDEGEFEFILGNKQLITVFLLVVVLLAIFFSAGYIMGRNSATPTTEAARSEKSVAVESPPAESQPATSNPAATPPSEPVANPADTISPPTGPEAKHAEPPAPSTAKPAPVSPAKPKPSAVGPAASPAPSPVSRAATGPASVTGQPAAGIYWQVVATARPDAEIIAEALTKKGFHAQVAAGPREGIFRVLVGPFKDSATQAQTRTGLEAAGFKNPIRREY